jgi:hypothetical protein
VNASQKSSLRSTLEVVNKAIDHAERVIALERLKQPMYAWRNELTPDQKRRARSELARTRGRLAKIAQAHGLEAVDRECIAEVAAELTMADIAILDTYSKALASYGPVEPKLRKTLDPQFDELRRQLEALNGILQGPNGKTSR